MHGSPSRSFGVPVVLALALVALLAWPACGGKATDTTTPGAGSSGSSGSSGTTSGDPGATDGGSAGCPAAAPVSGGSCTKGLVCDYTSDMTPCGTFTCNDSGAWEGGFGTRNCKAPPGLVCPTPESPQVKATMGTIDRACVSDADCGMVSFQTDCCGDALELGVSKASLSAAMQTAGECQRTFPGCGCPARPTVAETGMPDGGAGFMAPIEAFCDAGTCRTRYR